MTALTWLDSEQPVFPASQFALEEPSGLLAAGGNLSVQTLKAAYYRGIFPWYSEGEPPLWWTPNPRAILLPGMLRLGRTTEKLIKRHRYSFTTDRAFSDVIRHCSELRAGQTWIVEEMVDAYIELHKQGSAHSLEVWQSGDLVGGLYGVQVGAVFCGESMFHLEANASKLAFICLSSTLFSNGFTLIDCQLTNPFLQSLGVQEVARERFEQELLKGREQSAQWPVSWNL